MPRSGVTRAAVVAAATLLANTEGLEAITLARLAKDLKIKPPSLYNHISGLADVMRDLSVQGVREANACMSRAAVGLSRKEALSAVGMAYRQYAREQPGLYLASLRAVPEDDAEWGEASQETLKTIIAVLSGYGLEGKDALHAVRGLRAIIQGFVSLEAARGFGMPLDIDESFRRLLTVFSDGLARSGT